MSEKNIYLECSCHDPNHTLKFVLEDDPDYGPGVYVYVQLASLPLHKRIWNAIKYIFGYKAPYGHWEDAILEDKEVNKLINALVEYNGITRARGIK